MPVPLGTQRWVLHGIPRHRWPRPWIELPSFTLHWGYGFRLFVHLWNGCQDRGFKSLWFAWPSISWLPLLRLPTCQRKFFDVWFLFLHSLQILFRCSPQTPKVHQVLHWFRKEHFNLLGCTVSSSFETWFIADDRTKELAWGPFGKLVMCVAQTAYMNRLVRNVWVVGEKNRELVDKSKVGFLLLIEKSTESTFKIQFLIGGYLTEKNTTVTSTHITNMHSRCMLTRKFHACHAKLTYLAKIHLKFFNHWQLKLLEPNWSGRKYKSKMCLLCVS